MKCLIRERNPTCSMNELLACHLHRKHDSSPPCTVSDTQVTTNTSIVFSQNIYIDLRPYASVSGKSNVVGDRRVR